MSPTALLSVDPELYVVKRDGTTKQKFQSEKIRLAVGAAWKEVHNKDIPKETAVKISNWVLRNLELDGDIQVEDIQDTVEVALMKFKHHEVAKAYILYRQKRKEIRDFNKAPDPNAISDYVHYAKYARYLPAELRRELYVESVNRVEGMHLLKYPQIESEIRWAFDRVRAKKLLPSMRSMQYGGKPIEVNNARIYNCSFSHADRPRFFQEAMWLLLSGCGVGYSVQYDHVDKLPIINRINPEVVKHHVVEDSIEGWADAVGALINAFMTNGGYNVEFAYNLVRPKGTILKTAGGRAPGHLKLKASLEAIRGVLMNAQGRKLRPVEVHHMLCHIAAAVVDGSIREAAMIALFSLEDSEMMYVKTGDWFLKSPWLKNANNSCILKRGDVKKKHFKRIFNMTREWGEPGFYFTDDLEYGANPCVEIGMNPRVKITDELLAEMLKTKVQYSAEILAHKAGETVTGWAFCNLVEMNASKFKTLDDFMEAAHAATIIGTCQAGYTNLPYLGWVSEHIAEREALLGVSMTGMMRAPDVALNPDFQRQVAKAVLDWNRELAPKIGVLPTARATCIKPAGTSTHEVGAGSSGHHPDHAPESIRRVSAAEDQAVFKHMKAKNPHMCVRKPDGKWIIEFPMKSPPGAIHRDDLTAIEFLEKVKSTQENWVIPGTGREDVSPGLRHNVSNTVTVREHEWDDVAEYIWKNQDFFTGVALLPYTGDKDYAFAPNEAVITDADRARYRQLINNYVPVDYTEVLEYEDGTNLSSEAACAGKGGCEMR